MMSAAHHRGAENIVSNRENAGLTESSRKFHSEQLHNLYSSPTLPNVITINLDNIINDVNKNHTGKCSEIK
jgi:hypothetical protein